MSKYLNYVLGAVLIGAAFIFGKSCSSVKILEHKVEIKSYDSTKVAENAATTEHRRLWDSIYPKISLLQDSIRITKADKAKSDKYLRLQILKLTDFVAKYDSDTSIIKDNRDRICDSVINLLKQDHPELEYNLAVMDELIRQLDAVSTTKDSLLAINKSYQGTLLRTSYIKDSIFTSTVNQDKKVGKQLSFWQTAAKAEAIVILVETLKIIFTK